MAEDLLRHGQHRLARVQLFNWGTYDGYHDLPVARRGFLITGPSGSGKSTLLDAISTVLVPPSKLSFNAAAHGRGRTMASYIRGAYARGSDSETRELRARYLREGATWSAVGLTMTTADPGDDTVTTLVALFHLKRGSNDVGESGRAFLLFDDHMDITELRHVVTNGIDVRGLKKRWPNVLYNKSYPQFGQRLRARLGIADENAQLLLHRAMSAKGLDSLDRLFRDYMLEEPDTFAEARRAVEFFADLDEAHRRVVQTREQIAALTPLEELTATRRRAHRETQELGEELAALDGLAARFELDLAQGWRADAEAAHANAITQENHARSARHIATIALKEAERARDGNQTLRELSDALDHAAERVQRVLTQRDRLAMALQHWDATVPDSAEEFATVRSQIDREAKELEDTFERHDAAYGLLMLASARADEHAATLTQQITALAREKSNLDPKLLAARESIARSTGLPVRSLPFVGELIDITDSDWAGAAERVLGGLGRTLLVADEHADAVAAAADASHLGTRLVWRRVDLRRTHRVPAVDAESIVNVLKIADSPWQHWLHFELASRFDYRRVEDARELGRHQRAVTRAGQTKSGDRHIKDDRFAIDDRTRYVLGTSNDAKLQFLRDRLRSAEAAAVSARQRSDAARDESRLRRNRIASAPIIASVQWDEIDVRSAESHHLDVSERLATLRGDPEIDRLEAAVIAAQDSAKKSEDAYQKARDALHTARTDADRVAARIESLRETAAQTAEPADELTPRYRARFDDGRRAALRLDGFPAAEKAVANQIRAAHSSSEKSLMQAQHAIESVLQRYLHNWPHPELAAEHGYGDDAVTFLRRLRADDLPSVENRFFELNEQQSNQNLGTLAMRIRRAPGEIRRRIDEVNSSLARSEFDRGRFLRIDVRDSLHPDLTEFLAAIARVQDRSLLADDRQAQEQRFERMRELLGRLGSSDPGDVVWRNRCLDTRRHVTFVGVEHDTAGTAVNHHDSSDALSGGQAQKLVFFCLAAALRYQLVGPDGDLPKYGTVILDEAFDRSDPEYTRRAADVFDQFGFHLVLATPLKMIRTLQEYVGGVATVSIRDSRASRLGVASITEASDG
ncbi:ATP-binding protein [Candidatus Mycolicibacterium alkanivorans]|uniref:AAA family ATPase n=1 Tax=Candidatus Mycolicibacterium alkanivorans TaxID=2954114 RepID=A0ABS9YXE6_9MYCO|nr:ATP-binding protein [Candidatus Mycolicibacterium alkanivorans]MCI4675773.1 AAA family ATPase [Candidatus Mycolicibacterium alkanivorans]